MKISVDGLHDIPTLHVIRVSVRERENLFAKSDNNISSNITVYNGMLPGEHMPIYAGRL